MYNTMKNIDTISDDDDELKNNDVNIGRHDA